MSDLIAIQKADAEKLAELAALLTPQEIEQIKNDVARLVAEHETAKKNIGRPGFLYGSNAEYSEKQEIAQHTLDFLRNSWDGNRIGVETLQKSTPEFYASVTKANFNSGTDAQGGYLVPDSWANEIARAADKYGFAARLAKNYPMSTQTVLLATGTGITGYEVAETGFPTTTDSTSAFSQKALTAKRFAAGYIVSEVELRDALPVFLSYMAEQLGQGMAKRIDQTFFKGATGSSNHFDGITVVSGTNTVTMAVGKDTFAETSWTDIRSLEAAVPDGALENAIFVLPRTLHNTLRNEVDENSRPIWDINRPADYAKQVGLDNLGNAVQPGYGGSYPVVVVPNDLFPDSAASTACAVFGDFSKHAYYGIREGMKMKVYGERWNGVDLGHSKAFEVSASIGIAFNDPDAFAVLKTAAS
jgi:HK97 family phage major capsid protein